MRVRGVLKEKGREVVTIGTGATVADAVARLVENDIGSLPVVDGRGRLVGIFTERDVLHGLHRRGEGFCGEPIDRVMTPDPVACHPDDSVHDAMGQMSAHKIGQLPVVQDGVVVGVVSVGDVVTLLHQAAEDENRHLLTYLYGSV
ncbi:MAG TPA: CBS domain-containing protein [Isosphaeraceae bacterium]|jgi:CBS domain-containing protein|nr:CBS domain-containing protein [Isosphaeraceae bacterium]